MKRFFTFICMVVLFVLMLLYPQRTFQGAKSGLLLWFQTLLPTLLPFMVISNLFIHTNAMSLISKLTKPFLQRLFGISENACYAVIIGFLCGYPMGAKVISDLIVTKRISQKEGAYLLSFCNNTSPAFIISYLVLNNLNDESMLLGTLFILLGTPILCSFIFRKFYCFHSFDIHNTSSNESIYFNFNIIDKSIMNAFESITKVGGYVMLFSIFFSLCNIGPFRWILPALEITNGIPLLMNLAPSLTVFYPLSLALTTFGGFCSVAQTSSMLSESGLSLIPYITQKLITAMVTSLFAIIYIQFIHR